MSLNEAKSAEKVSLLIILLISLSLIIYSATINFRKTSYYFFGDESTYYCMAYSLVCDGDLIYDKGDLYRVNKLGWVNGPTGIILGYKPDQDQIYYAKPLIYPFFSAVFVAIFGDNGFLIFNSILFSLMIYLSFKYFAFRGNPNTALVLSLLIFFGSVSIIYDFWISPEVFNMFLITLGLFLFTRGYKKENIAYFFCGLVFGAATYSKLTLLLLFLPVLAESVIKLNFRKMIASICGFVIGAFIFIGLNYLFTGMVNPYAGERKRFDTIYPLQTPDVQFRSLGKEWSTDEAKFIFDAQISLKTFLFNIFYYFFGRFTGIFLYFMPFFLLLILFLKNQKTLQQWLVLLAIVLSIIANIGMIPSNYHGGGGAVGNRYFTGIYPAFIFIAGRCGTFASSVITWLLSGIFVLRLVGNPFYTSFYPGVHAQDFPFRLFPVELTLTEALPIFGPNKFRVPYCNGRLMLYFIDDYATGKEGGMEAFWVLGESKAEVIFNQAEWPKILVIRVENGQQPRNRVVIKGPDNFHIVDFDEPNQKKDVILSLAKPFKIINPYGNLKYIYKFTFISETGFVPRYGLGPEDGRFLGARITPTMDPFITAQAFLWKREYKEAIKLLELVVKGNPELIHAYYLLGKAYFELNDLLNAKKSLIYVKNLQSNFLDTEDLLKEIENRIKNE